jgi:hypothetical protein
MHSHTRTHAHAHTHSLISHTVAAEEEGVLRRRDRRRLEHRGRLYSSIRPFPE